MTCSILNNTFLKRGLFLGLLLTTSCLLFAQVQFKLTLLEDGETFQVSLIPEKTWNHPQNITSTAQVTVRVPTNSFEIKDLTSLQLDVEWQDNSRSDAPAEAPSYDYISFGLATLGTVNLAYEAGVEMPLFTFKNGKPCTGSITLINNGDDPFMAPNSRSANVGNSITIFGARGEAYVGNYGETTIPCYDEFSTNVEEEEVLSKEPKVYPSPAINEVFVDLNWTSGKTEGDLVIMDATGKEVKRQAVTIENGFNNIQMEVNDFPFGIYSIEVQFDGQSLAIDRFVKGNNR